MAHRRGGPVAVSGTNNWWHDAWATRARHHARDPESYDGFDYENYDYVYSTNLYYWDADETP